MKKIFILFAFLSLIMTSCVAPSVSTQRQEGLPQLNKHEAVVAIVDWDEEYEMFYAYCSGVFISQFQVLTAAHCVDDEVLAAMNQAPIGKGVNISFFRDLQGDGSVRNTRIFTVSSFDRHKDLALLEPLFLDEATGNHSYLPITPGRQLTPGEGTTVLGHPAGLWWTLTEGVVSRDRVRFPDWEGYEDVLFVQTTADTFFGNSGGPLLDKDGYIVGIASVIVRYQSHLAFYVHFEEIKDFLRAE